MLTYDDDTNTYHINGDKFFRALTMKYPPAPTTADSETYTQTDLMRETSTERNYSS